MEGIFFSVNEVRFFFFFWAYVDLCTMQENYPNLSAAVAGNRKFDVYMGIDVFGRNTYGGGQWNVCALLITYRYALQNNNSITIHCTDL